MFLGCVTSPRSKCALRHAPTSFGIGRTVLSRATRVKPNGNDGVSPIGAVLELEDFAVREVCELCENEQVIPAKAL